MATNRQNQNKNENNKNVSTVTSDVYLDLQIATECSPLSPPLPSEQEFTAWVQATLATQGISTAELTIRLVDKAESQALNRDYRQKDAPTNVLSFALDIDLPLEVSFLEVPLLGDLVVCTPLVAEEAQQQNKPLVHHWAHLIIHGTLHLMGYDHITDEEAEEMEALEKSILQQFAIPDPYLSESS